MVRRSTILSPTPTASHYPHDLPPPQRHELPVSGTPQSHGVTNEYGNGRDAEKKISPEKEGRIPSVSCPFLSVCRTASPSFTTLYLSLLPPVSSVVHISCSGPRHSLSRNPGKMPLPPESVYPVPHPHYVQFPSRRSVVHSTGGMVACTQPLAAEAGQQILKMGGNAAVSL